MGLITRLKGDGSCTYVDDSGQTCTGALLVDDVSGVIRVSRTDPVGEVSTSGMDTAEKTVTHSPMQTRTEVVR